MTPSTTLPKAYVPPTSHAAAQYHNATGTTASVNYDHLARQLMECAMLVKKGERTALIQQTIEDLTNYMELPRVTSSSTVDGQSESSDTSSRWSQNNTVNTTNTTLSKPTIKTPLAALGKMIGIETNESTPPRAESLKRATSAKNAARVRADLGGDSGEHGSSARASWFTGNNDDQEWCDEHFCRGCACKKQPRKQMPPPPSQANPGPATTTTTRTTTIRSKPAFHRPTNPRSPLIANGWIEQQRRSKMRSVWKEVLASIVEGRKPGEETTMWIQREVTNPATGKIELEALHQIPIKWLEEITYVDSAPDHRFLLKIYNLPDEFVFRCPSDVDSAQNWVLTLRSVKEICLRGGSASNMPRPGVATNGVHHNVPQPYPNAGTSSYEDEKKIPEQSPPPHRPQRPAGQPTTNQSSGVKIGPPPADEPSKQRMSIKELRAIAHGAGISTIGMERGDLEKIVARVSGGQPHAPAAASAPPTPTPPPRVVSAESSDSTDTHWVAEAEELKRQEELARMAAAAAEAERLQRAQEEEEEQIKAAIAAVAAREAEEEENKRKAAAAAAAEEEAEQRRVAAEEAEQRRVAAEEAARRRALHEEAEKRRSAEEAQGKAVAEAEEKLKKEKEEEIRRRIAEKVKKQQEEDRLKKEEDERKRLEAERLQKEEEEHQRRVAEQQAAELRRKQEEERRKQEEAIRQQQQHYQQQQQAWQQQQQAAEEERRRREEAFRMQQQAQQPFPQQQPPFGPQPPYPPQQWPHGQHPHPQHPQWQHPQQPPQPGHPQWQQPRPPHQHFFPQNMPPGYPPNQHFAPGSHSPPPPGSQPHPPPGGHPSQAPPQHPGGQPPPPHGHAPPNSSPINMKYAQMAHQTEKDPQMTVQGIRHGILVQWALRPPTLQILRPIEELITTIHTVFPPAFGVPGHEYFTKWTAVQPSEFSLGPTAGNRTDDDKLTKIVRKLRFFLHPDKLPKDFTEHQTFVCKLLWDISNDAWEEHKKNEEDLGWMRA